MIWMKAHTRSDPGGSESAARWSEISMIFCGILRTTIVLVVGEVGCFAFDDFEPIRGVSRRWNDESWTRFLARYLCCHNGSGDLQLQSKVKPPETRIDE